MVCGPFRTLLWQLQKTAIYAMNLAEHGVMSDVEPEQALLLPSHEVRGNPGYGCHPKLSDHKRRFLPSLHHLTAIEPLSDGTSTHIIRNTTYEHSGHLPDSTANEISRIENKSIGFTRFSGTGRAYRQLWHSRSHAEARYAADLHSAPLP